MSYTFSGTTHNNYEYYYKKFDGAEVKKYVEPNLTYEEVNQNLANKIITLNEVVVMSSSYSFKPSLLVSGFEYDGRYFIVDSKVFIFQIQTDGNLFFVENDLLRLYSYGNSITELYTALKRDIAFLYNEYALVDDNELAVDALALKRTLVGSMKVTDNDISK